MLVGLDAEKEVIKTAIKNNEAVLIIGETGVGKTSMVREIAKEQKKQFRRLNLNGSTGVEEFVGKITLVAKEIESEELNAKGKLETKKHFVTVTEWQDGMLVEAMRNGHWLLVDEINAALPEILFVLQSLLDDDRYVVLSEHDGEVVKPHKDFRFFASMNPPAEYAGTKKLNKALLSRFGIVLQVGNPSLDIMEKIILSHVQLEEKVNKNICKIADHINQSKEQNNTEFYCSIRDLISFAKLLHAGNDSETAFTLAILNKVDSYERDAIIAIASMYIPFKGKPKPLTDEEKMQKVARKLESKLEPLVINQLQTIAYDGVKLGAVEVWNRVEVLLAKENINETAKKTLRGEVQNYLANVDTKNMVNNRTVREGLFSHIKSACTILK